MSGSTTTLDIALLLASRGLWVFPCAASKKPAIPEAKGGRGCLDASADPDHDSRSNLAEYLFGSDPLAADQSLALRPLNLAGGQFTLRVTERKNAAALGRAFLYSTNLITWTPITSSSLTTVEDTGALVVRDATFPVSASTGFYKIRY